MTLEEELKMKNFLNPKQKAGLNILFTGNWLHSKIENNLKPYGLSHQQYNVLRILRGKHPDVMNLQDISERMIDKMSNATRLVEKLRIKGFLTRDICPGNRRKVEIKITDKGIELLATLDPVIQSTNNGVFDKITDEEANLVNSILDKLRE